MNRWWRSTRGGCIRHLIKIPSRVEKRDRHNTKWELWIALAQIYLLQMTLHKLLIRCLIAVHDSAKLQTCSFRGESTKQNYCNLRKQFHLSQNFRLSLSKVSAESSLSPVPHPNPCRLFPDPILVDRSQTHQTHSLHTMLQTCYSCFPFTVQYV